MRTLSLTLLAVALVATPHAAAGATTREVRALRAGRAATDMARIPAGTYRPLYASSASARVQVAAFALDRSPVTRGQYLSFVRAHPAWARGAVSPALAESAYLADWPSAFDVGGANDLRRPVTAISWHAARAYCAAQGKRLPTVDEWELAAAASETRRDASDDPAARRRLLARYARRVPGPPPEIGRTPANIYGVRDLHGVVWEWTLDFNPAFMDHAVHATGEGHHSPDHRPSCASAAVGATDPSNYPAFERYAVRAGLTARSTVSGVGFRCAADLPA